MTNEKADEILSDKTYEPVPDEFRESTQKHGMNIAQKLLREGKTIHEMMDDPQLKVMEWSDQEIAYLMGYVQNCIWQLQQKAAVMPAIIFDPVQAVNNLAKVLKSIHRSVQQARA